MATSVLPYETFSLIKYNILHQSKIYKNHFENSNFWGIWPLGHVGHVTYNFINILFISTGIFDDKLRPQILAVDTTTNSPLKGNFTIFEVIFVDFRLMKNICLNETESFVGRNISNHACQIFFAKSNCETMYHWFVLLEVTVVKKNEQSKCLLRPQLLIPTVPV
jgi:hypothetical protein